MLLINAMPLKDNNAGIEYLFLAYSLKVMNSHGQKFLINGLIYSK